MQIANRRLTKTSRALAAVVLSLTCFGPGPRFLAGHPESRGSHPEKRGAPARHLVICVDGLPYSTMEQMCAQGHFGVFTRPARLITPFPTLTNPGVIEVMRPLGVPKARGYEDYYYDPVQDRMRGGFFSRFRRATFIDGTFRAAFDYHPSPITMTLEYAVPPVSAWIDARRTLAQIRGRFEKSDALTYVAYLGATDSLAHVGGERMLRNVLAALDATCRDMVLESEGRVDVTIFSDHGNHFIRQHKADLRRELERAGFRMGGNLKGKNTVVQPRYGLVGCAVLYAKADKKQRVAEAATRAKGVDFAAYLQGDVAHIIARSGHARIEHRDGWYRYSAELGDPLALQPILMRLASGGRMREDGFIADADLFEATAGHEYPDALRRLWEGLTNHVSHRASVMVSFDDGYYEGSAILDLFAVLQSTHGNLRRSQTEGVLMTTRSELPPVVRAVDAWRLIAAP